MRRSHVVTLALNVLGDAGAEAFASLPNRSGWQICSRRLEQKKRPDVRVRRRNSGV